MQSFVRLRLHNQIRQLSIIGNTITLWYSYPIYVFLFFCLSIKELLDDKICHLFKHLVKTSCIKPEVF
ncbi:hypothetical protein EFER_2031 [Escherichia fergusonii ATCC 35469]|uniref:Uncharacterized protein n=1 Tax=Escherichia fergusonii (strain ATCC 35469 / DSM 13698 / CCUG 18766 / IAM 14443 / JCM 21226 / LMG 7866 / NBRC 102419 / NCTC 12128 / CDC 0568-73) TaxID=585054 RepID=B7LTX9_ESCF3|nr:hypothetical protein EFER_2031 [Escherichia fergusonii ATCC 35469]